MNACANILEIETSSVVHTNGDKRHSCMCQRSEISRESDLASKTPKLYGWLAKDTATLIDVLKEARSASVQCSDSCLLLCLRIRRCKR